MFIHSFLAGAPFYFSLVGKISSYLSSACLSVWHSFPGLTSARRIESSILCMHSSSWPRLLLVLSLPYLFCGKWQCTKPTLYFYLNSSRSTLSRLKKKHCQEITCITCGWFNICPNSKHPLFWLIFPVTRKDHWRATDYIT